MPEHDLEKLLGGFAADTLTADEKQQLYRAALQDQILFNALADEQALKELLADPTVRRRLLESLRTSSSATAGSSSSWFDWFRRPAGLAWAGGFAAAVFAVVLGTTIYQDSVKEAGRSLATEEATPAAPPASAPSVTPPTVPPINHPRLDTGEKRDPANPPPKEKSASKAATQETTTRTQPEKRRARDSSSDLPIRQHEEDAVQKPAESTSDKLARPEEEASVSVAHKPANTPPAPASGVAATLNQPSPALSARSLFYGEPGEVKIGSMVEGKELSQFDKPFGKLAQKRGLSGADQAGERAGTAKPLGIRYSLVANETEGLHLDNDAGGDSQTDSVDLMIEANQDGFFQVWGDVDSLQPHLLFPLTEEEPVSSRLTAYQHRRIPILVVYRTITVRFSRLPFRTLTKEDVVAIKQEPHGHLQESATSLGASGAHVTTTYVVTQDPSLQELQVRIPMTKP